MDTIINFDEEYFDDLKRIELYVYLSAAVDREIYFFLEHLQNELFNAELTPQLIKDKIEKPLLHLPPQLLCIYFHDLIKRCRISW